MVESSDDGDCFGASLNAFHVSFPATDFLETNAHGGGCGGVYADGSMLKMSD